jgi:hypothetical protein
MLSAGKDVGEPGPDEFGSFATKHPWLLGAIGAFWIGIWGADSRGRCNELGECL